MKSIVLIRAFAVLFAFHWGAAYCKTESRCEEAAGTFRQVLAEEGFLSAREPAVVHNDNQEPLCALKLPLVIEGHYGTPSMRYHHLEIEFYDSPESYAFVLDALRSDAILQPLIGEFMRHRNDTETRVDSYYCHVALPQALLTYTIKSYEGNRPQPLPIARKLIVAIESEFNKK